jgi:glycosyltransferase involved in cell wall biosynthesis
MKNNISLVINTKNEESNIKECIESAKDLADEVIVADMQSQDTTRDIAEKEGAKVYKVKNHGYVEPARNFAISKANSKWILLLDADERLSNILAIKLSKIIKNNRYDVVYIPRKNIMFGKWIKHAGWWPDYQVRFFKKGYVKWTDKIHKQPDVRGRVIKLGSEGGFAIDHHSYKTIDMLLDHIRKYTLHETSDFIEKDLTPEFLVNYYEGEFKHRYIKEKGYLDGFYGFVLSKFIEYYKFIEIARYWEKNRDMKIFKDSSFSNYLLEHYRVSEESRIEKLEDEREKIKKELNEIKSSRYYKVYRLYIKFKNIFSG